MEESPSLIQQTDAEFAENHQAVEKGFAKARKSSTDYLALALATCGVGYIKIAPGTWGSMVGVGLYLLVRLIGWQLWNTGLAGGWRAEQLEAWRVEFYLVTVLITSAVGIWAAGRAAILLNKKDPQQVVIDEVAGQFLALMFVPFNVSWWMILIGFVLFRFFDILKPYPIDNLQDMPGGFGVVVDDLVAGLYAAIVMSLIVAVQMSLT